MQRLFGLSVAGLALALTGCGRLPEDSTPSMAVTELSASKPPSDIENAIRRVYPAIVRLDVISERAADGRMRKERSFGSGALIRADGHLITNHHVAGRAVRIRCRLWDGEEVEGELVGTDPLADVTVVRLKMENRRRDTPLTVAEFGDSDALKVGDAVFAMGSPGGVAQSVTRGIVSNTALILPGGSPSLDGENVGSLVRWIAHDARIFGGNSGGPLVNSEGRIVGINEIGFAGIGGAIPGNLARSIAEQIIEQGRVDRSWTGLTVQPRLKGLEFDRGALVAGILPDSPAAETDLQPGDILLAYDGIPVNCAIPEDLPVFNALVLGTPIGKEVALHYWRNGEERETRLTTRRRDPALGRDRYLRAWGMTARNFTLFSAIAARRDNTDGVLVSSISAGGPAAQAEPAMQPGDVIVAMENEPIRNLEELEARTEKLLEGREDARPTLVAFERGRNHFLTIVRVGPAPRPDRPERPKRPEFHAVLQHLPQPLAETLGLEGPAGVRVAYVFPGLSADQAGLKTGDIILRFDGEPVRGRRPEEIAQFNRLFRSRKVGATASLEVRRGNETLALEMTLAEGADAAGDPDRYEARELDFEARALTLQDRALRKLPENLQGLLVERVEPSSAADLAGLQIGDIMISLAGEPTPDTAALEKTVKTLAETRPRYVQVFVRRGVQTLFLEIEAEWGSKDGVPSDDATDTTAPNGDASEEERGAEEADK